MYVISFNYGSRSLKQIQRDEESRDRAIAFINNTPGTKNVEWVFVPDPQPEEVPA